jgi:hypothetical protein
MGTWCHLVSHALNCCWVVQVGTAAYCLAISHLINHPRDAQGAIAAATGWLQLQQQQQQQAGLSRALRTVLGWLDQAQAAGPGPKVYSNMGYMRWGFVHAFRWGAVRCCACTGVGCCRVLWGCVHAFRWGAVGLCACIKWGAVGCCGALCMHSGGVLWGFVHAFKWGAVPWHLSVPDAPVAWVCLQSASDAGWPATVSPIIWIHICLKQRCTCASSSVG